MASRFPRTTSFSLHSALAYFHITPHKSPLWSTLWSPFVGQVKSSPSSTHNWSLKETIPNKNFHLGPCLPSIPLSSHFCLIKVTLLSKKVSISVIKLWHESDQSILLLDLSWYKCFWMVHWPFAIPRATGKCF